MLRLLGSEVALGVSYSCNMLCCRRRLSRPRSYSPETGMDHYRMLGREHVMVGIYFSHLGRVSQRSWGNIRAELCSTICPKGRLNLTSRRHGPTWVVYKRKESIIGVRPDCIEINSVENRIRSTKVSEAPQSNIALSRSYPRRGEAALALTKAYVPAM